MSRRSVRRAIAWSAALALIAAGTAFADFVQADADLVSPNAQTVVDLGAFGPGETVTTNVAFELVCSGIRHADAGQTVQLTEGMTVHPAEGGSISASETSIGPVPATWANDTSGAVACPSPLRLAANGPSAVTIETPPVPGSDFAFTVFFNKHLTPAGVSDASSVAGTTVVTFLLDVVDADTTPPVLHEVPAGLELMTSDPAGAVLDYALPSATDDRDPAPVVACEPPPGAVAPVGSSTVTCTATDAAGNLASASFPVLVHLVTVSWQEPVSTDGSLVVRGDRTVPVKVAVWLDGERLATGLQELVVTNCDPGLLSAAERRVASTYQADAGRWMGLLPTAGLGAGCHRVELLVGGVSLGGFGLEVVAPSGAWSRVVARPS